jgi:hypothetical protein
MSKYHGLYMQRVAKGSVQKTLKVLTACICPKCGKKHKLYIYWGVGDPQKILPGLSGG